MAEKFTLQATNINGKLDLPESQKAFMVETLRRWKNGAVSVIVKRERPEKTSLQLGYYYGLVLPMLVEHICGDAEDEEQTRQLHEWLKAKFLPPVRVEIVDQETGEVTTREMVASLADQNTKETTDYVDRVRQWGAEFHGVEIPDPDKNWRQNRERVPA